MEKGSLVVRVLDPEPEEAVQMGIHGVPLPPKETPFVVMEGPLEDQWESHPHVTVIRLEEYPLHLYNMEFFAEVQRPGEVSMEEVSQLQEAKKQKYE